MFYPKLKNLIQNAHIKEEYTIQELLEHFGESTIIIGILFVTIITSLPLPPWGGGFESIPSGILCIFFSFQGLINREYLYLPEFMSNYTINVKTISESEYIDKSFDFIDRYIVERNLYVFNGFTKVLFYSLVILNSLLMIIPIVFTNVLPSLCITIMSILWLLGDGLYFIFSLGLSVFVFLFYLSLGMVFSKWLYRNRNYWSFGLFGKK
jgi:hypothetical protein